MNLLTLTTALATSMSINMAQVPQQSVEMKVPESRRQLPISKKD